jgi:small conductance mechanosensitive channel
MTTILTDVQALILEWITAFGPTVLAIIVVAMLVAWAGSLMLRRIIARAIHRDQDLSLAERKQRIDTLQRVGTASVKILVTVVALIVLLSELGVSIGPILATAGVAGVALGFGAQYVISDIISGLFILIENQYSVGDIVCLNDTCGAVEAVTLRITRLRDLDGVVHHVPNSEITVASNMSKRFSRVNLNVGVAYDSDIDAVIEIINEVGTQLAADDEWSEDVIEPPQFLRVDEFGDSAVHLKVVGEVRPAKQWDVTGELRRRLKSAFDDADVTIPFPQRRIHQDGDGV